MDAWEDGQRDKEDEENIEQLHGGFLKDSPVRRTCVDVNSRATCFLLLLLTHHLVVAVEFVQGHGEVSVKAEQNNKHRCDKVINCGLPHRRPDGARKNADDGCECSADVGPENDSAGVLWGKFGCHPVSCVLKNPPSHVEDDN